MSEQNMTLDDELRAAWACGVRPSAPGANLRGAFLSGANLRGANLYSANLRGERDALQAKLDKVRALATENGAFPQGHSLFGSGAEHFVGGASLIAILDGGAA